MRSKAIVFIGVIVVLFAHSCIPSLHPLYTKDKIVFLKQLTGVWSDRPGDVTLKKHNNNESDMPAIWDFRKNDDDGYLLIHSDSKGRKAAFDIYVVKLGDNYFMDFYLTDLPKEDQPDCPTVQCNTFKNELASYHVIPVHTFAKLTFDKNEVKISMFDPDFLDKLFKQRQIRIKHETVEGGFVLTAPPEELQRFVEKYADHEEAYIDDDIILGKPM